MKYSISFFIEYDATRYCKKWECQDELDDDIVKEIYSPGCFFNIYYAG